ncbi:MAG: ankyrin repeat domain-containing protein [Helicobacteraceae bacterium]|jgi:ankyrin repeat protein|nr:ankyrin repeat domain-containing protein [Helicobacteraceae bacterium]
MPFMERLQSALILKTPMYHPNEAHIIEHTHEIFYETIIHNQSVQMVQMIIEGFDVDFHELGKSPPLIFAIKYNKKEIIETLLLYGANVNIQDREGNTALHFALKFEHHELVTKLLQYGADVTIVNNEGQSAIDSASKEDMTILSSVVSLVDTKAHNLFETARLGDLNRLVHSINKQKQFFQTNSEGQSLLHLVVLSNNIKAVLYLLNKGLDIDAEDNDGLTPLIVAMSHTRYLNVAILLLDRHATIEHISENEHSALSVAIRNNNPEGAKVLIKRGANINISDNAHTPLTLTHTGLLQYHENAQEYRDLETLLLRKGAKVDVPLNSLGWTPLCTTATKAQDKPNDDHMRLLLQLGADVNHRDINGRTPLMLAASMGRLASVKMLMDNYASNGIIDNFGWSALMFGVYYNHIDVVTFMLDNDVNPNQVSSQGLSALKIAQEHKRIRMVDLLLGYGAMVTKED